MKFGTVPTLRSRDFWRGLPLKIEWVEGEFEKLIQSDVDGIFVNPDESASLFSFFKEVPQQVTECQFVDFVEIHQKNLLPRSFLRETGSEFLAMGTRSLDTRLRAYLTGLCPWTSLFAVLAVEKGFFDIQFIVEKKGEAEELINRLKTFCFGVQFHEIEHHELTVQPLNGSLLVNTLIPQDYPALMEDLAYLNFLSPQGLVVETHESTGLHPLLEEARHSKIALLDGQITQAFAEYKAFTHYPGLLPWTFKEYSEKRKAFFEQQNPPNSPSV